jgi:4-amino-4-deoxy-L-arabinose transferase-like glycosyltransferase
VNTGSRHRPALPLILALAVLLRAGTAVYLGDAVEETRGGTYDQISYDALALRVATGHGFSFAKDWWPNVRANQPTAFWSYPYTLFLAAVYALAGHHPLLPRLIQALAAGVLMSWLAYRIGRRVFDERTGVIAAAIAAGYLYFVEYGAALMTESFYIVGILWTLDAAMGLAGRVRVRGPRRSGLLSALELGLAAAFALLMRQAIAAFLLVLAAWLVWVAWRHGRLRSMMRLGLASVAVVVLAVVPFVVRNYRAFGQLAMPNTNAGFAFFWANHPVYGTQFQATLSPEHGVTYRELIPPELRDLNEAELDRALLGRGVQFILDDPLRYVMLSLSRVPIYFQFWPTPDSTLLSNAARLLSFGLFLPFMLYGLVVALCELGRVGAAVGAVREPPLQREYILLLLSFVLVYTATHLASWANVRYRLPADAVLILFAGAGIGNLMERVAEAQRARDAVAPQIERL